MGSEIHVKSSPGQGSTFWFEAECPEIPHVEESKDLQKHILAGFHGECNVLIVDDNEASRILLREMLRPLGFEIIEAENGQAGIELSSRYRPDLIFMDRMLPDIDGEEATQEIRKAESRRQKAKSDNATLHDNEQSTSPMVIIAVSATVFEESKHTMLRAGCNDFLPKPIQYKRLLECLQSHLTLDWIYQQQNDIQIPEETRSQTDKMRIPPQDILAEFHHLAMMGDILEIEEYAKNLQHQNPEYSSFVSQILEWANAFEISHILTFIEQFLQAK
jgi:CheY-like chemotaxis protein